MALVRPDGRDSHAGARGNRPWWHGAPAGTGRERGPDILICQSLAYRPPVEVAERLHRARGFVFLDGGGPAHPDTRERHLRYMREDTPREASDAVYDVSDGMHPQRLYFDSC